MRLSQLEWYSFKGDPLMVVETDGTVLRSMWLALKEIPRSLPQQWN